ncbi:MAG: phage tail protein [Actinomycetota bacterium]|nr:phage tail protein [Actinomycetota bacterium]
MSRDGAGGDGYDTFGGRRFGTLQVRRDDNGASPAVASGRAYLRGALPAIYQDGDFGMRFVGALETLLDPPVAVLDALHAYFSAELAPADILELMAAWLGVELDETHDVADRREVVRRAAELARRRGTKAGLELALRLAFPKAETRVEDAGRVLWATEEAKLERSDDGFVVICDVALPDERKAMMARLIEDWKPVGATYRLRFRAPSPEGEPNP